MCNDFLQINCHKDKIDATETQLCYTQEYIDGLPAKQIYVKFVRSIRWFEFGLEWQFAGEFTSLARHIFWGQSVLFRMRQKPHRESWAPAPVAFYKVHGHIRPACACSECIWNPWLECQSDPRTGQRFWMLRAWPEFQFRYCLSADVSWCPGLMLDVPMFGASMDRSGPGTPLNRRKPMNLSME